MTGTLDTTSSHTAVVSWMLRPPNPSKDSRNMRCNATNATCSGRPRASRDMVIVRGHIMRLLLLYIP